jgi:hypothetical protein
MKLHLSTPFLLALVALLLLAVLALGLVPPAQAQFNRPAVPQALTPGQNAAILGAEKLLLDGPFEQPLYLPLVTH